MTTSLPPVPPGSPPRPPAAPLRLPWEERDRLGFVEAFVQTFRLFVMQPADGFSRLRPDGDLTSPLLFGIIVSWIAMVVSQIWSFVFSSSLRNVFGDRDGFEQFFAAPSGWGLLGATLFWPVIFVVIAFIGSGIVHLSMMLVGGLERSEMGFEGTLKVYVYASVSWIAALIPFAGGIVTTLWNLVLQVTGLAEVHRTTQGRTLIAVLVPTMLCCACSVAIVLGFGAMIVGGLSGMGGMP